MIYDISLPLSTELAIWPGDPAISCERLQFGKYHLSRWTLGSHSGTHVDAPRHNSSGETTVDELDPAVLIGPCRVVDLPEVTVVTAEVLRQQSLVGVERLLLHTRNSRRWAECPETFDAEAVALDVSAAQYLLEVGVRLVGIDGLSVEAYGGDGTVHDLLLGAGVVLLEGVDLSAAPAGAYQLLCAPLKLRGSDGAPARVFLLDQVG